MLQLGVDGRDNVVAGNSLLDEFSILESLLDLVPGVAQVDVVALFSPQLLFPGRLDAGFAGIVARPVLSRMLLDVLLVDLRDVSQKVSSRIERIVADASDLSPEPREVVLDLGELHVGLGLDLLEHHHALVADLPSVPGIFSHLVPDEIGGHPQRIGKHQGVERGDLFRSDQDVIGNLVSDNDLPVPVVDYASGGVDDVIDHRVVGRVDLVLVLDDLDVEQLPHDDGGSDHQSNDQFPASTFCRHRSAD